MAIIIDWFEAEDGIVGCSKYGGHNECTEDECTSCPYAHERARFQLDQAALVEQGSVVAVGTFLGIDDDGDKLFCLRHSGPCRTMTRSEYTPQMFCGGCRCLKYEFADS